MEKFKLLVSAVNIPDGIAIGALRNTEFVHFKFHDDLYRNPPSTLQDAVARSYNFIKMEEDTRAILGKKNASKPAPAKSTGNRPEPRPHYNNDKNDPKKFLYVINEEELPESTVAVREKVWNHWDRPTD
ncbi:hypothetical protein F2Q70_00003269 [Brassica cretica]|uniref:Uncharacterized protein n=1 Tax=Brassica cretica TaxID=69181 RepID=A0A8S9IY50_BRACR|nr:hypothetical protein F2Q70_00003269 [Brassica cretica]